MKLLDVKLLVVCTCAVMVCVEARCLRGPRPVLDDEAASENREPGLRRIEDSLLLRALRRTREPPQEVAVVPDEGVPDKKPESWRPEALLFCALIPVVAVAVAMAGLKLAGVDLVVEPQRQWDSPRDSPWDAPWDAPWKGPWGAPCQMCFDLPAARQLADPGSCHVQRRFTRPHISTVDIF
ncbi:uncharacterized protein LOC134542135 [Bacillus rossius redtenbacheri]|uniref:uncharacterized protein LOC134542135 n=1 Tax=Bacillus rossius redtenbacheri TaxID=93214 RepID=UPI002FDDA521